MAEKLWDLANAVSGFAALQNLAFTFGLAKGDFKIAIQGVAPHWTAGILTVIFAALYSCGVYWCKRQSQRSGLESDNSWNAITRGSAFTVWLFTLVTVLTLLGHSRGFQPLW